MNATTDPRLLSFLDVAPESDFPIQNLPYGVFRPTPAAPPRAGVAIGDWILDLAVLEARGLLYLPELAGGGVFAQSRLNEFAALGPPAWHAVRARVSHLLRDDVPTLRDDSELRDQALLSRATATLGLPFEIGDYTDFYASLTHAQNVGRIFRGPTAELPPQYRCLPIGYHGRASSIVASGTSIRRPRGQFRLSGETGPTFGPTRELDFELEVGLFVGRGNELGRPIATAAAAEHSFGFALVNDWSARDIQQWEYVPLGPFLGKNFATTISPWVVPAAALEPFRCDGPVQNPPPLEYLRTDGPQAFDIRLEVALQTARMKVPQVVCRTNLEALYWSFPQLLAHHTSNGCNLRPGDLLASGTVSGPSPGSFGSLLETTERGGRPLRLVSGEERAFLADGDTVVLHGTCEGPHYRLGFGECRGTIGA